MGQHLNRAKTHFGTDTRGLLEGGRYALLHTRTLELDDLRPYVPGDDTRDIDWKASARSNSVLIKRFVSEKHHKILLAVDAGRDMSACTPSGEIKRDVAAHVMGAIGLITLGRADEIGMIFGDSRGTVNAPNGRGESHLEGLLERFYTHSRDRPGRSDIVTQLCYAATAHRRRLVLIVVSDEPDVDDRLRAVLAQLSGRHDVLWVMVADMPAIGSAPDEDDGYDVGSGRVLLGDVGPKVVAAYRRAEQLRVQRLDALLSEHSIPHVRVSGSTEIRAGLVELSEAFSHVR